MARLPPLAPDVTPGVAPVVAAAPALRDIAWVFLSIGMQSFGGGMTAWIRRDVVQRRGWMSEQTFVGGLALAQITPGANGVNLAVFVGTTLRGRLGALAALSGMLLVPVIAVLALGAAFTHVRDVPGVESAMAGLGAAAIGMNVANGLRMTRRGIRKPWAAVLMLAIVAAVGIAGVSLLLALAVAIPLALWLAGRAEGVGS